MEPTEIIQLTLTARLAVFYDEDARNPRTEQEPLTSACSLYIDSRHIDVEPGSSSLEVSLAWDRSPWNGGDDDGFVTRWAKVMHSVTIEWHDGTAWWVDPRQMSENWPDLVPGTPEYIEQEHHVIDGDRSEYQRWADGEVYGVELQRLRTWALLQDDGEMPESDAELRTDWDSIESIWGCYLDSDYTAQSVAREMFDLTEEESAAATAA